MTGRLLIKERVLSGRVILAVTCYRLCFRLFLVSVVMLQYGIVDYSEFLVTFHCSFVTSIFAALLKFLLRPCRSYIGSCVVTREMIEPLGYTGKISVTQVVARCSCFRELAR